MFSSTGELLESSLPGFFLFEQLHDDSIRQKERANAMTEIKVLSLFFIFASIYFLIELSIVAFRYDARVVVFRKIIPAGVLVKVNKRLFQSSRFGGQRNYRSAYYRQITVVIRIIRDDLPRSRVYTHITVVFAGFLTVLKAYALIDEAYVYTVFVSDENRIATEGFHPPEYRTPP